jgi:hypothetical protein
MTDIILSPYSKETLTLAKDMYFSKISPTDISKELDISINDLGLMIFGSDRTGHNPECWYQQSLRLDPDSIAHYVSAKRHVLSQVEAALSKKIVDGALALRDDESRTLSLDEMKTAVSILKDVDNMNRLERGEATQITETYHGFTLREIKNGSPITVENEHGKEETPIEEAEYRDTSTSRGSSGARPPLPRG